MLIEFYIKAKRYDEALSFTNEIIELMPFDLEAREKKAKILLAKNDWQGASQEFELSFRPA